MTTTRQHYPFLEPLRAGAALLVVWAHLFCHWPQAYGQPLQVAKFVSQQINEPLGIIQDFGWFGVCLFFLISGFVITHAARYESAPAFAIKRFFRIVPMLTLAVILGFVLLTELHGRATPWHVLTNITLINYWIHPQVIAVGVGWTLAIEVLFYALMLATYPMGRWPAWRLAVMLLFVGAVIDRARAYGDNFFLFAASAAYLPYLLIGQLLYLLHTGLINKLQAAVLGAATYAVLSNGLRSIHVVFLPLDNSYLVSFAWALAVFLLAWRFSDGRRAGPLARWTADTSYSLYLLHGVVGFSVASMVVRHVGVGWAVAMTVLAVAVSVLAAHVLVERPTLALGKRLAARWPLADRSVLAPLKD